MQVTQNAPIHAALLLLRISCFLYILVSCPACFGHLTHKPLGGLLTKHHSEHGHNRYRHFRNRWRSIRTGVHHCPSVPIFRRIGRRAEPDFHLGDNSECLSNIRDQTECVHGVFEFFLKNTLAVLGGIAYLVSSTKSGDDEATSKLSAAASWQELIIGVSFSFIVFYHIKSKIARWSRRYSWWEPILWMKYMVHICHDGHRRGAARLNRFGDRGGPAKTTNRPTRHLTRTAELLRGLVSSALR